jgi:hypothetical protein
MSKLFEASISGEELSGTEKAAPHDPVAESLWPRLPQHGPGSLAARFIVPPFSVLNAQSGYWEEKQTRWIPVFDPLLCEIVYQWHMPKHGGLVLDPFAGASARGIVAGCLGYQYTGFETSREKIKTNERQALLAQLQYPAMKLPKWICADPASLDKHLPPGVQYDLIFTDLPVYNSKQATSKCKARYTKIFGQAIARLRQTRFVVVMARGVCGDDGAIQFSADDVVGLTKPFGVQYYNRAVLTMSGNERERLLFFLKGRPKDIPTQLGII